MIVSVAVFVGVPVIVAALVNGNDIVDVIDAVPDARSTSIAHENAGLVDERAGQFRIGVGDTLAAGID